jgi:hypothetical protein
MCSSCRKVKTPTLLILVLLISGGFLLHAQGLPNWQASSNQQTRTSQPLSSPSVKILSDGYLEVVLKNGKVVVGRLGKPVAVNVLIHEAPIKIDLVELPENIRKRFSPEGHPPWVKLWCDGLPVGNELMLFNSEWASVSDITVAEVSFTRGNDEEKVAVSELPDSLSSKYVDSAKRFPNDVKVDKISGSYRAYTMAGGRIIVGELRGPLLAPVFIGKDTYYVPVESSSSGAGTTTTEAIQRGIYQASSSTGDNDKIRALGHKLFTIDALEDLIHKNEGDGCSSNWTMQRMRGFSHWAEEGVAKEGASSSTGMIRLWFEEYLHAIERKNLNDVEGWAKSIKNLRIKYPLAWKQN